MTRCSGMQLLLYFFVTLRFNAEVERSAARSARPGAITQAALPPGDKAVTLRGPGGQPTHRGQIQGYTAVEIQRTRSRLNYDHRLGVVAPALQSWVVSDVLAPFEPSALGGAAVINLADVIDSP